MCVAAKAVIINNQRQVLILREADTYEEGTNFGKWELPGGRINNDEPFYDGLRREISEETGLEIVGVGQPVFVGEWWPVIKGIKNHIVGIYIKCEMNLAADVKLSREHDKSAWIDAKNVAGYDLMPIDKKVLEVAWEMKK